MMALRLPLTLSEDDVLSIEPRGSNSGNEELGAVRVRAGVGHRQVAGSGVLDLKSSKKKNTQQTKHQQLLSHSARDARQWRRRWSQ